MNDAIIGHMINASETVEPEHSVNCVDTFQRKLKKSLNRRQGDLFIQLAVSSTALKRCDAPSHNFFEFIYRKR